MPVLNFLLLWLTRKVGTSSAPLVVIGPVFSALKSTLTGAATKSLLGLGSGALILYDTRNVELDSKPIGPVLPTVILNVLPGPSGERLVSSIDTPSITSTLNISGRRASPSISIEIESDSGLVKRPGTSSVILIRLMSALPEFLIFNSTFTSASRYDLSTARSIALETSASRTVNIVGSIVNFPDVVRTARGITL